MLDIKFIRENKELIELAAKKKHLQFDVAHLIEVDAHRRELIASIEAKKAQQGECGEKIVKTEHVDEKASLISMMQEVKKLIQEQEEKLKEVMKEWQMLMVAVPNIPDMSVPEGESDAQNIEVRTWGEKPILSFAPRNHIDLIEINDLADFERGAKVSGFRGYFLKGDAVLLNMAIWQYTMELLVKKGFTPMMVPSLVRRETLLGSGYLPQGEEDLYKTQDNEYLAGTGEVATMAYHSDEVLEESSLPKKFIAFSPCFRREAGSHGKDTKGLYRVHEFFKLEQVVLCEANHETSVKLHEELTANAEELLQGLGIPYHVVVNCGGDLGLGQVKKYDIEAWMPGANKYGETHSASYFHDFQSRRLNIRYRDVEGKMKFVHSLNNTAVACPRILISILENYQQEDGSIKVPEVLQKYVGKALIKKLAR